MQKSIYVNIMQEGSLFFPAPHPKCQLLKDYAAGTAYTQVYNRSLKCDLLMRAGAVLIFPCITEFYHV